jgi:hypothetical protein
MVFNPDEPVAAYLISSTEPLKAEAFRCLQCGRVEQFGELMPVNGAHAILTQHLQLAHPESFRSLRWEQLHTINLQAGSWTDVGIAGPWLRPGPP